MLHPGGPGRTVASNQSVMNLRLSFSALLFLTLPLAGLRADELPRAKAEEESAVRALVGKKSIITGKVTDAFESPKGMTFLNLDGGKFTLVAWKDSYAKFEGGSPAKLYNNKTIEVTGAIEEYRPRGASKDDPGKLQIKLNSPDQVKVLTEGEAEGKTEDEAAKADPKAAKEKPAKVKKEPLPKKETTPPAGEKKPTESKPAAPAESPGRVDSKKYFK
jgi:DNA/RNA endonuclease YhcR with UshA esterase domain